MCIFFLPSAWLQRKRDWLKYLRSGVQFSMQTATVRPYGSQICLEMEQRAFHWCSVCVCVCVCVCVFTMVQAISLRAFCSYFSSSSTQFKKTKSIRGRGSSAGLWSLKGCCFFYCYFLLLGSLRKTQKSLEGYGKDFLNRFHEPKSGVHW